MRAHHAALVGGLAALTALTALTGCKSRAQQDEQAPTRPVDLVEDAHVAEPSSRPWPELEGLPRAEPVRVITLPSRPDVPRFDVGGPVIVGDVAVVSSSQLGFAAVDWRRGALLWTKPAGAKVAPPAVRDGSLVLIGTCLSAPDVPPSHTLLGCMRIVTPAGSDEAYFAIHGDTDAVELFMAAAGPQEVWIEDDAVRWRRGDAAVAIDPLTGVARAASAEPPPVVVEVGARRWAISHTDGKIVARHGAGPRKGRVAWETEHDVTALLGSVWLPEQSPMIRAASIGAHGPNPAVRLLDIDATGSLNGTAAWTSVPGISLLGHAISPVGDVALAVRMDRSIKHDFIAAYAANALLIYVYPLPVVMRADPVGVAIALDDRRAPEAVVVFHDGDLLTILPTLSSPPTAPGAVEAPSGIPTP